MSLELDNRNLFEDLKAKYNLQEIVFAGNTYLQFSKEYSFNLINTTRNPSIIKIYSLSIFNDIILSLDEECSIYNLEKINNTIKNSIHTINQYFLLQKQKKLQKKLKDIDDDFT